MKFKNVPYEKVPYLTRFAALYGDFLWMDIISPKQAAEIVKLVEDKTITHKTAKDELMVYVADANCKTYFELAQGSVEQVIELNKKDGRPSHDDPEQ